MRIRNRLGQWIELPDPDGLVNLPNGKLMTPEKMHALCVHHMATYDALPARKRWEWSIYGIQAKRPPQQRTRLAAKTDPTFAQWRAIGESNTNLSLEELGF